MSTAPTRGIVPQRQRRHHHHHHHHHQKHQRRHSSGDNNQKNNFPTHNTNQNSSSSSSSSNAPSNPIGEGAAEEKRPKVNPIFLWAAQCEQRIVEIRCEDYDKRNRIKLTKTPQGWRSIPRTALTTHPVTESTRDDDADRHCEQIFSTNAKNEEKENTSADGMKLKKLKIDQIDDGQIDGVDDAYGEKERHKHKKKKHGEKRKIELVGDQVLSETLVTTSWKMKKRRKLDKLKKRKRLMLEQEIVDKIKVDNLSEVKIKEEFKKKYESINDIKKTDTSSVNDARDKKSVDDEEVDAMDGEHKKCNDFGKLKENQNLQPRVVLEQLHLSQLPTKIHNIISRTELEANLEKNVSNSSEASVLDNFNQNNSDDNIDLDSETAAVNKEDLEEILNMLDSNHFPISVKETKPNLIDSTDLTRSCTKLGGASFIDQTEKHSKPELANCEKKERNLKRSASKSLDETIQRLEKSVKHQKTDNSSQEKPVKIVDYNKNEKNLSECESNNVDFTNCTATSTDIVSTSSTNFDKESELAALKNAEILTVLRKTPDITVSLATKPTEKNYKNPNLPAKTILPTSKSPDSQTNFAEKIEKNFPELSITVPSLQYSSKIGSTVSKNRIESPESTVNFLKHENQFSDADLDEYDVEDYNDAIVKNVSHNNYKHYKNPYDSQNYRGYGNPSENDNTTPTRYTSIPNLKPISRTILRNSEAQAKKLNLSKQSDNNFNDERTDDIHSTISPPCNKISLSATPSKQSSYHLERLLPSPPCSVTCSEDAKNDLTIKSILSNSKSDKSPHNYVEEESDLNLCHSSDSSRTRKNSEEHYLNKFTKDNSISMSPKLSKNKTDNTELNNPKRPMSNDNLYNPFSVDYVDSNCSLPPNWCSSQKLFPNLDSYGLNNVFYSDQKDFVDGPSVPENFIAPTIFLDPASQLRKLIKTSGDMIPDPLLVPREYLPLLAGAPLTEIPKLLAARPELRLPEALSRPELLRDPDLLVISLAHLQHVLDHGEGPVTKMYQPHEIEQNQVNEVKDSRPAEKSNEQRPKLSCKPIGKLMPSPIDLSHSHKLNPNPPLLRVRSGLLKEEPEVSSTANSPDDSQLWHPLFGSKTQRQRLEQPDQQAEQAHQASWHRTTLAS